MRARSIQNCLHMVVNNERRLIDAFERAAESQGFAVKWGGRMVTAVGSDLVYQLSRAP